MYLLLQHYISGVQAIFGIACLDVFNHFCHLHKKFGFFWKFRIWVLGISGYNAELWHDYILNFHACKSCAISFFIWHRWLSLIHVFSHVLSESYSSFMNVAYCAFQSFYIHCHISFSEFMFILFGKSELLGQSRSWIWCLYFGVSKASIGWRRRCFMYVHL